MPGVTVLVRFAVLPLSPRSMPLGEKGKAGNPRAKAAYLDICDHSSIAQRGANGTSHKGREVGTMTGKTQPGRDAGAAAIPEVA